MDTRIPHVGSFTWKRYIMRPLFSLQYNKIPSPAEWVDFLKHYGCITNKKGAVHILSTWCNNLEIDVQTFKQEQQLKQCL